MASFSVSGLVPMSAAIAGSEVAITVESMFSMNRAVATMSGMTRCLFIDPGERKGGQIRRERAVSPSRLTYYCGRRCKSYILPDAFRIGRGVRKMIYVLA